MAAVPSIGRADRVQQVAAPEADLTRSLYERYGNQIFRYCLHQLGSREEAEDAVQSTFLNAFRAIKRGVVPELESAWLFKIAHNVCLSRRRSTWRRGRIESPTDFEVVEELAPAPSRQADELIGLQDVLERMPETQRRAILLREWQGLSYREIAKEMELTQAAVETLIFRARRSLAQGLEEPAVEDRRRVRGADLANMLGGLKSLLLSGGAAVKVAAAVAVVSATTVVSTAPVTHHHHRAAPAKAPAAPAPAIVTPATHASATKATAPAHAFAKAHSSPATPTVTPPSAPLTPAVVSSTPAMSSPPAAPADSSAEQVTPPAAPESPSTPAPGQAKKQDVGADTPPPATKGNADAPGQAKKQEEDALPAADGPAADSQSATGATPGKAGGNGNGWSGGKGQGK